MVDSGANVCIKRDAQGLVNVRTIRPVTVNLALDGSASLQYQPCTELGYLPMLRTDGVEHLQPFLIHPAATDTIMSPESVVQSSPDFHQWVQVGYCDGSPGRLEFKDQHGHTLLDLNLEGKGGL